VKHEAEEAAQADRTGGRRREGGLVLEGGRSGNELERPPVELSYRLKRSVQAFPASDGVLYLVRLGAGDDLSIEEADCFDRALIDLLGSETFRSEAEIADQLAEESGVASRLRPALADLKAAGVLELRPYPDLLNDRAAERYARQLIYLADLADPKSGPEPLQLRLGRSSVMLIGCGGLGSWVASGLAGAGVGSLVLVDDDRVELSNLNRQLLFRESQVGELKTSAAADSLRAHNSEIEVVEVSRRLRCEADLTELVESDLDLVVATADWPPHELPRWVNRACVSAGVPWIGAGQFPPRLRVGPLVIPGESACLECLEGAVRREYPLYEELAAWRSRGELPDPSVGPVCGVIGSLIASEALHLLTEAFQPESVGQALMLDLRTMELRKQKVSMDASCRVCGTA